MTRGKISGYYVNSILAKREAKADGYDEAILLDTEGYVSRNRGEYLHCAPRPDQNDTADVHPRRHHRKCRHRTGTGAAAFLVVEERFTRDEMYIADEVFVTGTAAELTPVREIDNRRIGTGKPGP